jgi:ParB family protein of integrating conjugative element (PFGI_1 class)
MGGIAGNKRPVGQGLIVDAGPPATVPSVETNYPISEMTMDMVDVDHIAFYEGNPRTTRNPKYDEIKESIRATGQDNPLPISHRPGDPSSQYIIYAGGNTRLQILKELWAETGDARFQKAKCRYVPFGSDLEAQAMHLRENEMRGDMTFIDSAMTIQRIRHGLEAKLGEKLSYRKLEDELKVLGIPKSNGLLTRLDYAVMLHTHIPKALHAGMGKHQIERLQKLEKAALAVWRFHGSKYATDQELRDKVFIPAMAGSDSDTWAYESAEAAVRLRLLANLPQGTDADGVQASLKLALADKELKAPEPEPAAPIPPTMQPPMEPAYAPPDQYGLFGGGQDAQPAFQPGGAAGASGGGYVQPPVQYSGGGDAIGWDGLGDDDGGDDGLESWMPHQPHRPEVVVEGSGHWLKKLRQLRERNYELAVRLANLYVPKGGSIIAKLDVGYGFLPRDTFDVAHMERLVALAQDGDDDGLLALMHTANIWWFLAETSGMVRQHDDTSTTNCPPELLMQYTPVDCAVFDADRLVKITPPIPAWYKLQTWWLKLTDSQLRMVFELVGNIRTIFDIVLEHAKESGGAGVWELSTGEVHE